MFTDMLVNISIYHGRIIHHTPFTYVSSEVHQVNKYDAHYLSQWEVKELVHDL
jgi:hypothetical protein